MEYLTEYLTGQDGEEGNGEGGGWVQIAGPLTITSEYRRILSGR